MKKFILEIAFYVLSVLIQIIPVVIAYGAKIPIPPLFVWSIVPFYLLIGSIYFSRKYHFVIIIWRIIPCFLSLYICYNFNMGYINSYFLDQGYPVDPWTVLLVREYYKISLIIIVAGIVLYQTIVLIRYFYKQSKNTPTDNR